MLFSYWTFFLCVIFFFTFDVLLRRFVLVFSLFFFCHCPIEALTQHSNDARRPTRNECSVVLADWESLSRRQHPMYVDVDSLLRHLCDCGQFLLINTCNVLCSRVKLKYSWMVIMSSDYWLVHQNCERFFFSSNCRCVSLRSQRTNDNLFRHHLVGFVALHSRPVKPLILSLVLCLLFYQEASASPHTHTPNPLTTSAVEAAVRLRTRRWWRQLKRLLSSVWAAEQSGDEFFFTSRYLSNSHTTHTTHYTSNCVAWWVCASIKCCCCCCCWVAEPILLAASSFIFLLL